MRRDRRPVQLEFVPFRINWGDFDGADARRLLALVCRRGGIRGNEVGAIQIGTTESLFEVAAVRADEFTRAARRYDPRDPNLKIEPLLGKTFERRPSRASGPPRSEAPPPPPAAPPAAHPHGRGRKDRPTHARPKKRN